MSFSPRDRRGCERIIGRRTLTCPFRLWIIPFRLHLELILYG